MGYAPNPIYNTRSNYVEDIDAGTGTTAEQRMQIMHARMNGPFGLKVKLLYDKAKRVSEMTRLNSVPQGRQPGDPVWIFHVVIDGAEIRHG